jgi:hypothetical protein
MATYYILMAILSIRLKKIQIFSLGCEGGEILRTDIWRTFSIISLLVGLILTLLNSIVWSESILFSGTTGKNPCFTHAVFHGSEPNTYCQWSTWKGPTSSH